MNETELIERSIQQAENLDGLAKTLWVLMTGEYSVWEDGTLLRIRQLVGRINGLRIVINANEHPPPHFHVTGGGINASFTIEDCALLAGELDGRRINLVKWWHARAQQNLIAVWNQTRPEGCSVGEYRQ